MKAEKARCAGTDKSVPRFLLLPRIKIDTEHCKKEERLSLAEEHNYCAIIF